jgi:hypothetical protein
MATQYAGSGLGLMNSVPVERSKKSILVKPKPQYVEFTQFPDCDEEDEAILKNLGDFARAEIRNLTKRAKAMGIEISSFGLIYDPDYDKYGILVAYKGQELDPLEERLRVVNKIFLLNEYIENGKSSYFHHIGSV